jgi:hypothetical protein
MSFGEKESGVIGEYLNRFSPIFYHIIRGLPFAAPICIPPPIERISSGMPKKVSDCRRLGEGVLERKLLNKIDFGIIPRPQYSDTQIG